MKKMKVGILLVLAVLALVSVASAALPASVTAKVSFPGPNSYFDVDITSGGNYYLPNDNDYLGWCADSQIAGLGSGNVYVPYDSRVGAPVGMHTVDWNKVNYIINNKGAASKGAIQQAIWYYDNGRTAWPGEPYLESEVQALIADADANGAAYVPAMPGEKYIVILWKNANVQPVIIEVPIPENNIPEFPTLALPIAMMIGIVGVVQYIRTREE